MQALDLLVIGEPLGELQWADKHSIDVKFAGDVLNTAIYAKRLFSKISVGLLTAIGTDRFSENLSELLDNESLDSSGVKVLENSTLGLYGIELSETGERSFTYWRNSSAAKRMVEVHEESFASLLANPPKYCLFTGITLAILDNASREKLISFLSSLSAAGTCVAFDPNYRPILWESQAVAKWWMEKAFGATDLLLPGVDELELLFELKGVDACNALLSKFDIKEVVFKADDDGNFVYIDNQKTIHMPFVPAEKQVDSTAAGDSFAGAYLGSKINGADHQVALHNARQTASTVVQYQGAIISEDICELLKNNQLK
ncbi:sugar kinase [Agaribacter flavus]|uniref:Sugar kinase n=1 Tax=Agaribacter flavus TaxID=1902781 RepID=A0ABV7FP37_9ALTE